jgi:hypothetical protein
MRILFAAVALSLGAAAAAQQMFKCRDAGGKITYAGQECEELGLSPAGEVKGRASMAPAYSPSPPPPAVASPKPAASPAAQGVPRGSDASREPERRCFTVKTAKGTATRCNDVPDETK